VKTFYCGIVLVFVLIANIFAQQQDIKWTPAEKAVYDQIHTIRQVPDDKRGAATQQLALQIRQLPLTEEKIVLALGLAERATEGDFGHAMLQEVATTLAAALKEHPMPDKDGQPNEAYMELAELARYEHVDVSLDDARYTAATAVLQRDDEARQKADFTLSDLVGKNWTLSSLRGKVVLVNFWATWCPPCRKEMPDLESLYQQYEQKGLIVLAISDEENAKVKSFIEDKKITYPILLDPKRKVNDLFQVEGIPKSFVYNREGKLVAQSIDMRTRHQFLEMLGKAGLQ